jgi:hypothetical protein
LEVGRPYCSSTTVCSTLDEIAMLPNLWKTP